MNQGRSLLGPDHLRHLVRAVVWQPVVLGGTLAMVLAYDGFRTGTEQTLAAASIAVGCAFVLDDPAWVTVSTSPAPLWWRRCIRIAFALPLAGVLWLAAVQLAGLPRGDIGPGVLEVATMIGVTLAAGAVAMRRSGDGLGGSAAGPMLLVLVVGSLVLPTRWAVHPVVAHQWRWVLLLGIALLALVVAGRDPAARDFPFLNRLRPRTIGDRTQKASRR